MKLISKEILVIYMERKGFSVQRLATYAECSKSMIGHLRTGEKTSCTRELATRISEALDVPWEGLFEARTSAVSSNNNKTRRKVKA